MQPGAGSALPGVPACGSPQLVQPQQATWSIKQWKKLQEPQRNKTHWDYVLQEMEWLSKDFREERQWKIALARKAVKAASAAAAGRPGGANTGHVAGGVSTRAPGGLIVSGRRFCV